MEQYDMCRKCQKLFSKERQSNRKRHETNCKGVPVVHYDVNWALSNSRNNLGGFRYSSMQIPLPPPLQIPLQRRHISNVPTSHIRSEAGHQHIGGILLEEKMSSDIESSTRLQITTNSDDMMGPTANPSPNSRNQFSAPASKNPPVVFPNAQNNPGGFQHQFMSRPVSVQIPRPSQIQQLMNQSQFSPQSHEQLPPAQTSIDPFSRPPSDNHSAAYPGQSNQKRQIVHVASHVPSDEEWLDDSYLDEFDMCNYVVKETDNFPEIPPDTNEITDNVTVNEENSDESLNSLANDMYLVTILEHADSEEGCSIPLSNAKLQTVMGQGPVQSIGGMSQRPLPDTQPSSTRTKHNCLYCDSSYFNKCHLTRHLLTCRKNPKSMRARYLCEVCGTPFTQRSFLKRHIIRGACDRAITKTNRILGPRKVQKLRTKLNGAQKAHLQTLLGECSKMIKMKATGSDWSKNHNFDVIAVNVESEARAIKFIDSIEDHNEHEELYVFGVIPFHGTSKVLFFMTSENSIFDHFESQLGKTLQCRGCPSWMMAFVKDKQTIDWERIRLLAVARSYAAALRLKLSTVYMTQPNCYNGRSNNFMPIRRKFEEYLQILHANSIKLITEKIDHLRQLNSLHQQQQIANDSEKDSDSEWDQ